VLVPRSRRRASRTPPPGPGLSRHQDFTALFVLERSWPKTEPGSSREVRHYAVRHLEPVPPGIP
jgi:hypothetical protein